MSNPIANPNPRTPSDRPSAVRTRDSATGGAKLKLAVAGKIDGYALYWENDEDGQIEQLLHEGFQFVRPTEVQLAKPTGVVNDDDLANRVSRFVGKDAEGKPLRAYLLKVKQALWDERQRERVEVANQRESDMRRAATQEGNGRYIPQGLKTSMTTYREQT